VSRLHDIGGAVEARGAANLVITEVDPIADIDALTGPAHIHAVVKDGWLAIDRGGVFTAGTCPPLTA
jgi:imidazolonepropionase-like amidohydrolase